MDMTELQAGIEGALGQFTRALRAKGYERAYASAIFHFDLTPDIYLHRVQPFTDCARCPGETLAEAVKNTWAWIKDLPAYEPPVVWNDELVGQTLGILPVANPQPIAAE